MGIRKLTAEAHFVLALQKATPGCPGTMAKQQHMPSVVCDSMARLIDHCDRLLAILKPGKRGKYFAEDDEALTPTFFDYIKAYFRLDTTEPWVLWAYRSSSRGTAGDAEPPTEVWGLEMLRAEAMAVQAQQGSQGILFLVVAARVDRPPRLFTSIRVEAEEIKAKTKTVGKAKAREAAQDNKPSRRPSLESVEMAVDWQKTGEEARDRMRFEQYLRHGDEHPEEAPLRTLDTEAASKATVTAADDPATLLPLSDPPSMEEWTECCRLLLIEAEQHRDRRVRSIRIPGTSVWATPQQVWTAFRMLTWRQREGTAGGLLADEPGSGKTHTVLVFCLLRALLFHSYTEVRFAWERSRKTLRSAPETGLHFGPAFNGTGTVCPCGNSTGIECYATPGSVARRVINGGLARGPVLVQAGSSVLEDWKTALAAARVRGPWFQVVLFDSAAVTPRELLRPTDVELRSRLKCKAVLAAEAASRLASRQASVEDCTFAYDHEARLDQRPPERFLLLAPYDGNVLQATFQVPVTVNTVAAAAAAQGSRFGRTSRGATELASTTVYGCPVGVHIVDEFHRMRDVQSPVVQLALAHRHIRQREPEGSGFEFWAVTGTPLSSGRLTDLRSLVQLLERPLALPSSEGGGHERRGGRLTVNELERVEELRQRARGQKATEADRKRFERAAAAFFSGEPSPWPSSFVIRNPMPPSRRTTATAAAATDNQPLRISLETPPAARPFVQYFAEMAQNNLASDSKDCEADLASLSGSRDSEADLLQTAGTLAGFQKLSVLQALSSFPSAARVLAEQRSSRNADDLFGLFLHPSEAAAHIKTAAQAEDVGLVPSFARHWRAVTADSPKVDFVLSLLRAMDRDHTERPATPSPSSRTVRTAPTAQTAPMAQTAPTAQTSAAGASTASSPSHSPWRPAEDRALKKLVVMTPSAIEAVFYFLALRNARPDCCPVLFHSKLSAASKKRILDDWASLRPQRSGGRPLSRVLVVPFDVGGTGLNLQCANYQVLTGPLRLPSYEFQCFARTRREGQLLPVHHFLLLDEHSPYDRSMVARRVRQPLPVNIFRVVGGGESL